jgi:hypothetical protein
MQSCVNSNISESVTLPKFANDIGQCTNSCQLNCNFENQEGIEDSTDCTAMNENSLNLPSVLPCLQSDDSNDLVWLATDVGSEINKEATGDCISSPILLEQIPGVVASMCSAVGNAVLNKEGETVDCMNSSQSLEVGGDILTNIVKSWDASKQFMPHNLVVDLATQLFETDKVCSYSKRYENQMKRRKLFCKPSPSKLIYLKLVVPEQNAREYVWDKTS